MTIYAEDHAPPPPKEPHLGRFNSIEFEDICKRHFQFRLYVYIYALGYFVIGVLQWIILINCQRMLRFLSAYFHLTLLTFYFAFVMLLALIFFHKKITNSNRKFFAYTFVVLQLGTPALILPMRFATRNDHLFAVVVFLILLCIGFYTNFQSKETYLHEPTFLMAWTIRYFVLSSMGIVVSTSLQNPYFDVSLTSAIMFFTSIFLIVYAKSLNSIEFFLADKYGARLYSVLLYFPYISVYSMGMWLIHEIIRARELEI